MTARPIVSDPETGIPDLIRRLSDDSKRLVTNEVQLARMEAKESFRRASRGTLWLALAFGATVVMLTALTLFLITLIGRIANDHMWVGALVVGVIELGAGFLLIKRGLAAFAEPSYTLEQTRQSISEAAHWSTPPARG